MAFWWAPFQTRLLRRLTLTTPPAASLLCHLFYEPLGHGGPVLDVSRLCWYVAKCSQANGNTLTNITDVATAVMSLYQQSTPWDLGANFGISYFSISLSLNVTLTLMIVVRLALHRRNLRKALGTSNESNGLYTAIFTMLIESYTLYAIDFLLYIVPWALGSSIVTVFSSFLGPIQVRAVIAFPDAPQP